MLLYQQCLGDKQDKCFALNINANRLLHLPSFAKLSNHTDGIVILFLDYNEIQRFRFV